MISDQIFLRASLRSLHLRACLRSFCFQNCFGFFSGKLNPLIPYFQKGIGITRIVLQGRDAALCKLRWDLE